MNEEVSNIFGDCNDSDEENENDRDVEMETDLDSESCRQQLLSTRPKTCGVMAFHSGTEEALFLFVQRNAQRGDPASVLKAIDIFCYSRHWMMHCGDRKVQYLERALALRRELRAGESSSGTNLLGNVPQGTSSLICVEIGSYCGYSAVKIASTFQSENDFLYCVEYDAKCVLFTERMVEFAGLSSRVKVISGTIGCCAGVKNQLMANHGCGYFDVVFIDHDKARYLEDLMIIEACDLLQTGSVVVADNVLSFGQPLDAYLQHVRDTSESGLYRSSELNKCYLEYSNASDYKDSTEGGGDGEEVDGLEISVYRQTNKTAPAQCKED